MADVAIVVVCPECGAERLTRAPQGIRLACPACGIKFRRPPNYLLEELGLRPADIAPPIELTEDELQRRGKVNGRKGGLGSYRPAAAGITRSRLVEGGITISPSGPDRGALPHRALRDSGW